jgi:7-cyano-7-deazaguanine synthase
MARAPEIVTPLLAMSKADVVRAAVALGVDAALTWSCYGGGPSPCGACGACAVRARGFAEAGIADPLMGGA